MNLPAIKTEEEVEALSPEDGLAYSRELAAAALELLKRARDGFACPAGSAGADARARFGRLDQAVQNVQHLAGISPPMPIYIPPQT